MNQQHTLKCKWSLWTNYAREDKQRQADFAANLVRVLEFTSLEELAFVLQKTHLRDFNSFFVCSERNTVPKFTVADSAQPKRIEAINYFREDIEPTWEYGQNGHGGQIFVQVPRQLANKVCEAVLLWVVGELPELADEVLGVRFVDRMNWATNSAEVRIELWVKFSNIDKEKVTRFCNDFNKLAVGLNWHPTNIEFRNSK